jgi:hypothetical protein
MKIQNKNINPTIQFLDKLNLKGRGSLGRTKLKEKLSKKNEAVTQDQIAIIDEFDGWTDKEKGQFKNTDKELNEAINELLMQEVEVEYNSPFRKDFVKALEEYEEDLSGSDADVYALLFEELIEEEK